MIETADFVIVTALEEERDAVLAKLPTLRQLPPSDQDVRVYYAGTVATTGPESEAYAVVLLMLSGMGRVEGANATKDAIARWRPRYVLLVGVAGGIGERGVRLGDVLISDQVVDYELQKLVSEGPRVRYQVHRADPRLLNASKALIADQWRARVAAPRPAEGFPNRCIGPIATGDKVAAVSGFLEKYRGEWSLLIGIEMEAGGVSSACFESAHPPGFFMVRGVSDLADEQKDSSAVGSWRAYACDVAAAFAVALLESGPLPMKGSVDEERAAASLTIAVEGWFKPNQVDLLRALHSSIRLGTLPHDLTVTLEAPQYEELRRFIRAQSDRSREVSVVADQLAALADAESRMDETKRWCERLLHEVGRQGDTQTTANCCDLFVRLSLANIVLRLAHHQVDGSDCVFTDFEHWFDYRDGWPGVVSFVYGSQPWVEIILSDRPGPSMTNETILLPRKGIENDGGGGLITDLWESAIHLPPRMWTDYVVPQWVAKRAVGVRGFSPWRPEEAFYGTEGQMWIDGSEVEGKGSRLGTSHHFMVLNSRADPDDRE